MKEKQDVARAEETVEAMRKQLAQMEEALSVDIRALELRLDASSQPLEEVPLKCKKSDITVKLVALVWQPLPE
jgi:hypothetical protein